jgi:hypothetical protein
MSLLNRIGVRAGGGLSRTRIGHAVVIHGVDGVTAEARVLAEALPADPEHHLVVADLPPASPLDVWSSFVAALPRGRRPLRVVPGRQPREVAPEVWQWLADRTRRPVLAPYGTTNHGVGWLFVHSVDHSGWGSFRRGVAPVWCGKRFPRPAWDSIEVSRVRAAGMRGVVEPLPAGVWLRPDVGEHVLAAGRARLTSTLPCLPDALTIVLGAPEGADLRLSDIAEFWRTVPPPVAASARFVRYGGVELRGDGALGQELADVLGTEVRCYTGIPAGSPGAPEVWTLRSDGSLGWNTFAQAFAYRPGGGAARPCVHRAPVRDLGAVAPGVYWFAPGVVLEVVAAGLWLRPADQLADPAGVRSAPLDPVRALLIYEATGTDHLRELAEGLVHRLDEVTRPATRLLPSTALLPTPPAPVAPVSWPVPQVLPPTTPDEEHAETDLPWLSRLVDTMSIPVPARPFAEEHRDDR